MPRISKYNIVADELVKYFAEVEKVKKLLNNRNRVYNSKNKEYNKKYYQKIKNKPKTPEEIAAKKAWMKKYRSTEKYKAYKRKYQKTSPIYNSPENREKRRLYAKTHYSKEAQREYLKKYKQTEKYQLWKANHDRMKKLSNINPEKNKPVDPKNKWKAIIQKWREEK